MKARISQLHNTEAAWQKYKNWVPEAGEIIIYDADADYEYARLKVGNGTTALNKLPFLIDAAIMAQVEDFKHQDVLDGGRI